MQNKWRLFNSFQASTLGCPTFVGLIQESPVLDPLAVKHLNNWSMICWGNWSLKIWRSDNFCSDKRHGANTALTLILDSTTDRILRRSIVQEWNLELEWNSHLAGMQDDGGRIQCCQMELNNLQTLSFQFRWFEQSRRTIIALRGSGRTSHKVYFL